MTTPLGDFYTLVEDSIGRSTSVTSLIPLRVRMAAEWIERNYTFQYMKQWRTFDVSASATYPHILSLSGLKVKAVELIRRRQANLDADGGYYFSPPLKPLKPQDRSRRSNGVPESYWLNGLSSIVLNTIPNEDMTFEAHLIELTNWGSDTDWTHWLLDNATHMLLVRTIMMLGATRLRDPKLWEVYKAELDLELASFKCFQESVEAVEVVAQWEPPGYDTYPDFRQET